MAQRQFYKNSNIEELIEQTKTPATNTVYKLWLGHSSLGISCGFPKASFYLERFVPTHATAHIHKRYGAFE